MKTNKAISPVVATALLLVIVVVSAIGFQTWFNTYSSSIFVDIEKNEINTLNVEGIIGNNLYIKSNLIDTFTMFEIVDSNNNIMCKIEDNIESQLKADTRLLLTFDNETFNGTHIKDLSGYGNNGILKGEINCSSNGYNKNSCEYDGIDDYILIPNSNSINITKIGISISLWININEFGSMKHIISRGSWSGTNTERGWDLVINLDSYNRTIFRIGNSTQNYNNVDIKYLNTSTWYHIVGIIDISNNILSIYKNGVLEQSKSVVGYTNFDDEIYIGTRFHAGYNFNGSIDEVAIYSKALLDSEVKALYNSQKAKFYEQLLPIGVKKIDISTCNLQKGQAYDIIAFTNNQKLEQTVMKK